MTIEEEVRKKHEFDDMQDELLKLASELSLRELEIAMAKLADKLLEEKEDTEKNNLKIKGEILRQFYEVRKGDPSKEKKFKRSWTLGLEDIYRDIIKLKLLKDDERKYPKTKTDILSLWIMVVVIILIILLDMLLT